MPDIRRILDGHSVIVFIVRVIAKIVAIIASSSHFSSSPSSSLSYSHSASPCTHLVFVFLVVAVVIACSFAFSRPEAELQEYIKEVSVALSDDPVVAAVVGKAVVAGPDDTAAAAGVGPEGVGDAAAAHAAEGAGPDDTAAAAVVGPESVGDEAAAPDAAEGAGPDDTTAAAGVCPESVGDAGPDDIWDVDVKQGTDDKRGFMGLGLQRKKSKIFYDAAGAFDNAMQTPAIQKPAYTDVLQMLMASNPCDPANPFAQTALAAKEPKGKGKGKKKGKGKGKGNLKGKATFKKKGGLTLSAKSKQKIIEALARRKESSVGGVGGSGSSYAGMASRPAGSDGGGSDGRAHGGGSDVPASGSGHRISTDDDDGSAVIKDFQVPFFNIESASRIVPGKAPRVMIDLFCILRICGYCLRLLFYVCSCCCVSVVVMVRDDRCFGLYHFVFPCRRSPKRSPQAPSLIHCGPSSTLAWRFSSLLGPSMSKSKKVKNLGLASNLCMPGVNSMVARRRLGRQPSHLSMRPNLGLPLPPRGLGLGRKVV